MRFNRNIITAVLYLILCQFSTQAFGQQGFSLTLPKPKQYEERTLRSERTDQKKFTLPKRFVQNTITHYNYVFNANNKLNDILDNAKAAFVDDYSQLLPFYNYTLDATAADSVQLDSLLYKTQTGIALHDLRNDWIDNLYLLWGAAYYLRKDFDSAYYMFQYINYAFAEKEKDGYYKTIGSSRDGNSAYSISTKEKNSLTRRMLSEPPSRNEAFIWQIRNYLAQDYFTEAASLIVTLKNDPVFPDRLRNDLEEVQALWFYKHNMWDSAAVHLERALGNASNQQERARWEYLIAQLYELSGKYAESEKFFSKAIGHTTDPILDIYARLYSIRVNKDGGENYIDKNIAELLKMAKRDKYVDYRDIIYYMAAQMELERNNPNGAMPLLLKSTQYSSNNPTNRNRAFQQLAELSFEKKLYRPSLNYYDSMQMDDPALKNPDELEKRREMLAWLVKNLELIERHDSLQRIAAMPEEARKEFVRKLAKQLRKEQGLKDESVATTGNPSFTPNSSPLFINDNTKGEWYFYNNKSRAKGAAEFKARWGTRPNVDNWRRSSAIAGIPAMVQANTLPGRNTDPNAAVVPDDNGEITSENLYKRLPLTPEQLQKSNDSIQAAMFNAGKTYIQEIEDCSAGTEMFENLRTRFPQFTPMEEVLFNLYYCYNKNGEAAKASAIKKLMTDRYGSSNLTTIVNTGKNPQTKEGNPQATKTYEEIYDLFIEGRFDEALARKKIADSIYQGNYWTPQLLYIEAVYYTRQRQDSNAVSVLNEIVNRFPGTPLASKATNLINVLGRRNQIEDELNKLVVNRPAEDTTRRTTFIPSTPVITKQPEIKIDTSSKIPVVTAILKPKIDTIVKPVLPPPAANAFTYAPNEPYYVVLILNKIDPVFTNEAKNAFIRHNRETYYNKQYTIELSELDPENKMMLISSFANVDEATTYVEKTRPRTANEIIPWLKGGKYYFTIITERNLQLLKTNKNLEGYKTFLNQYVPGKF